MLKKAIFQGFCKTDLSQEEWKRIAAICEQTHTVSPDKVSDLVKDADGLFVKLGTKIDRRFIDSAPRLKVIGMFGTGYGRIDAAYARERNIAVFNVADYATRSVAEFVFAALLNDARHLPRALTQSAAGDYSDASFMGTQLFGKSIGIIGLGSIGACVAKMAADGFGMNVLYWSQKRKKDQETKHIRYAEINTVLSNSDYVSLHLALAPGTETFMSAARIDMLRAGTVLINTAPMELLDLKAVEVRLAKNHLSLILDHSDEMPAADLQRLSRYTNCTIYPPIAYTTREASTRKQSIFVDNIVAAATGREIPNRVN
jgi:phosphoglycerate dehydrogenase-like enzyme